LTDDLSGLGEDPV